MAVFLLLQLFIRCMFATDFPLNPCPSLELSLPPSLPLSFRFHNTFVRARTDQRVRHQTKQVLKGGFSRKLGPDSGPATHAGKLTEMHFCAILPVTIWNVSAFPLITGARRPRAGSLQETHLEGMHRWILTPLPLRVDKANKYR